MSTDGDRLLANLRTIVRDDWCDSIEKAYEKADLFDEMVEVLDECLSYLKYPYQIPFSPEKLRNKVTEVLILAKEVKG